ncbi:DUF1330 domain-containing protein [Henriciella marina]|uniref:DUF1330 domain-containing protein n=1 Tax=Henriciella marina TaxID=453851 RepID=UPI00035EB994|nr:DUF1330 domain-containing protein [Henriciella marina]
MDVTNELMPSDSKQVEAMMQPGPDGPIYMLNLLKFREKAEYADGRESDLSGREAYQIYGRAVSEILKDFGGRVILALDVNFLSLGRVEELWDEIAIAEYPRRSDMVAMSMSEAWQEAAVHRAAGLKGQLNIECVLPPDLGDADWARRLLARD